MLHIVYASSEQFAPVLYVALTSLTDNKARETELHVHVLVEKRFSHFWQSRFDSLGTDCTGFELSWIEMGDRFARTRTDGAGVGKESNYRLIIAELLPQVKRCLYLDADTIVLRDLRELEQYDLTGLYLAGLHSEYFIQTETEGLAKPHFDGYGRMIVERAGGLYYDQYIGTGTMLMNLELLRKDQMTARFLKAVPPMSGPLDQDILNACCYGKIGALPVKYCVDLHDLEGLAWYREHMPEQFQQLEQASKEPYIIHFSDQNKPWRELGIPYEKIWWKYAFMSDAADFVWDEFAQKLKRPRVYHERELNDIKNSFSYRLGKAITYIPRKIISACK